jgi:hypothetical protein
VAEGAQNKFLFSLKTPMFNRQKSCLLERQGLKWLLYCRCFRGDNLVSGAFILSESIDADSSMTIDIEGKILDVDIFLGKDFKTIRYEIKSINEINPLESAFCLWIIVKGICDEAGVSPELLVSQFATPPAEGVH